MATMSSAAGYQNLPVGNWAPAIYSQKVLKYFRRASVVEAITNTAYTGEIATHGDAVNSINRPTNHNQRLCQRPNCKYREPRR